MAISAPRTAEPVDELRGDDRADPDRGRADDLERGEDTAEDRVDDGTLDQRVSGDVEHRVACADHRHAEDRPAEGRPDHN